MKKRELDNLRSKELKELVKMAQGKKVELAKTKAEVKAGKEKNIKKAKNLKVDIAQIATIIREKEIVASESNEVRVAEEGEEKLSTKVQKTHKNTKMQKVTQKH